MLVFEIGRGPSIWDTFAHQPNIMDKNATGDVACDSYHKYEEDVQLLRNLGVGYQLFKSFVTPHSAEVPPLTSVLKLTQCLTGLFFIGFPLQVFHIMVTSSTGWYNIVCQ